MPKDNLQYEPEHEEVNLSNLCGGAIEEVFQREWSQVLTNIGDLNTPAEANQREDVTVSEDVLTKRVISSYRRIGEWKRTLAHFLWGTNFGICVTILICRWLRLFR